MKKSFLALFAVVVALGFGMSNADAARMGGGKSVGVQRQAVSPKPAVPAQQATPAAPQAPAATPVPATPKRNWLGPIAGLAAGLGIAALLSHFGLGEGLANALMIGLLVMAAVVVFRMLFRRPAQSPASSDSLQYAGAGHGAGNAVPSPQAVFPGGAVSEPANPVGNVPANFDVEGFLRVAKLNFVRLQAAHDAGNMSDIREFVSPELFAEISLQVSERAAMAQHTDVVTLNGDLLEVTTEAERHIASVHFTGMIRETVDAAAVPFSEVWHLSKPVEGGAGWVVVGIQQMQ